MAYGPWLMAHGAWPIGRVGFVGLWVYGGRGPWGSMGHLSPSDQPSYPVRCALCAVPWPMVYGMVYGHVTL